jgi:predicted ATPase
MANLAVEGASLRVRIGLHTGNGVLGGDNYVGVDVHRASRISDSAHGGQVLVSDITARLVENHLPEGARLEPLGRYRLTGFPEPSSLHQVVGEGLPAEFPPLRSQRAGSLLPAPLTDFVGRSEEISAGLVVLENHRLLTLTGPGGTGKTRLALEIARTAEPGFADGAYFVALASLTDSALVPMTVLEALQLKTAGGIDPMEHLTRHLADRSVLLVLDNFEQLLEGAPVVSELLAASPGLSVIVTSRSPLRVRGERELPVPPLGVPSTGDDVSTIVQSDGVRLFVSRAEAVRPDFSLDDENIETVSAITRSLDGLPLAIELAASRLRSLTPELVLERLGNQLLAAQASDLPARQQTIVNAIGWSYDLLDESSKILFEELSVFSGSFGLEQAELVCSDLQDVLDGLSELVEQSLVRQTSTTGEPRYRMLSVIREFAYAALVARGGDRKLLDRHASVYLALARRADPEILTSRQQQWLTRLSEDHDNLRAAFDHAIATHDETTALGLAGCLWRFWQIRGHLIEGRRRVETALALSAGSDPLLQARALTGLGGILYWQGEWEAMLEPYAEALELSRLDGDEEAISEAMYNLSFARGYDGDLEGAEELLHESLELSERIARPIGVGRAEWGLANMGVYREDYSESIDRLHRAVSMFSGLDAPFDLGWSWFMLAHTYHKRGESDLAREPLRNALEIFSTVGDVSALALIFGLLAALMVTDSQSELAAFFTGAAHRVESDTGVAIGDVDLNRYPEMVEFLDNLDLASRASFEEGTNVSTDVVVERAFQTLR